MQRRSLRWIGALAICPTTSKRGPRDYIRLFWKADTRPLHQTIDAILAQGPSAIARAADNWFFCALAERDPAAAERALVALGDNRWWTEAAIILSRSFGEGLLARITKDEARARTAFKRLAPSRRRSCRRSRPRPGALRPGLNRRCSWAERAGVGRRPSGDRAHAAGKRCHQRQCVLQYFAITAAWAGEKELALQQLEAGLRAPVPSRC